MEIPARKLMPALERNVLRDDRGFEGLTPKQWEYAHNRALKGMGVTDAYLAAYEPEPSTPQHMLYQHAAAVESNHKVQAKVRMLLLERQGDASLLPKLDEAFVLTGIAQLAVGSTKDAVRLKGYELLGKALGVFDKAEAAPPPMKTVNDIDEELRKRLAQALRPEVIEAEAVEIARNEKPASPDDEAGLTRERKRKPKA